MTIKPLADPALGEEHASNHRAQGCPAPLRTLVASVALACSALVGQSAHALALGRVTVQSALGEPLQAEIDVPDINSDEAASLRASVASPDAFRRAGLDYNPMLSGLQVSLQRRADGRAYLRLSSDRTINDPFLDLILEANWSAGRIVRDYTMLFDPPASRQAARPVAPTAPVVSAEARQAAPVAVRAAPREVQVAAAPPASARTVPAAPVAVSKPAAAAASGNRQVKVRAGDTANKIAANNKPAKVSLDQMLVALLQSNPDAFIGGNVNRLKAGVIMDVPSEEQILATPEPQATQEVLAQARDFDEFRRKLAAGVPVVAADPSKRLGAGKVQGQVEEKKAATAPADKLSLQKATITAQNEKTAQDKLAADMAAKEAAAREQELKKNISDLNKLAAASTSAKVASAPAAPAPAPVPATKPSEPGPSVAAALPAPTPSQPEAPAPVAVASQPEPVASAPAPAPAPAPVVSAPKPAAPPPMPIEEPSLMAELMDNPMVPAAGGGLVALLAGLAFYRMRQRKKSGQVDSSFMESRLQPDSFFGASGGQKVDTAEGDGGNSSLAYSPSQLDAAGDVDPVAEADVYLAYGRDLQAEEILKEAVRTNPSRAAIHFKLLQIYAKRRDVKAYIAVATDAYKLSRGLGPEWEQAAEVGHELDPTHPLFMPESDAEVAAIHAATQPLPLEEADSGAGELFAATNLNDMPSSPASNMAPLDLDLDLDFSDEPVAPAFDAHTDFTEPGAALNDQTVVMHIDPPPTPAFALPSTLDFDPIPEPHADAVDSGEIPLEFDAAVDELTQPKNQAAAPLEFDLGGLSLDLDPPAPAPTPVQAVYAPAPSPAPATGPDSSAGGLDSVFRDSTGPDSRGADVSADEALATKLALAEEFQAIGDDDGARTLAQEVADAATGNLKAKAQRFLAELG